MPPRRKKYVPELPEGWSEDTRVQVHGRWMEPGTEVTVMGLRGRFRFVKQVTTPTSTWLQVWGGKKGFEKMHSVSPERVKTVHRLTRMRGK
jgi:hypothetical protein